MTPKTNAAVLAPLIFLLFGCAAPVPDPGVILQNSLNTYKQRALPNKAFAIASTAQGGWVAGWIFSQPSIDEARDKALAACRERALVQVGMSACRVIYENDTFMNVAANTAALPANPSPQVQPPIDTAPQPKAPETQSSTGSGTFISSNGNVLTAEHVVRDARKIELVARDGLRYEAKILASSRNLDLAILTTDAKPKSFIHLRLTKPVPGTKVFTVGYPVPGVLGQEPKVSDGIINAASGLRDETSFIQISIPIQPGNSGGPVVTEAGELIGVVTSTAAITPFLRRTGALPQNVNWAARASLAVGLIGQESPARATQTRELAISNAIASSVFILVTTSPQ